MKKTQTTTYKNFGLDFIRAAAITLVLINHSVFNVDKVLTVTFFPFGFYGVELFFVLSGFLIGQILIRDVLQDLKFKNLVNFWIRRWFRTLPLYYLVLIIRILFMNSEGSFHLKYFIFIQNLFFKTEGAWFGESWSLAVEEWFYLLVPLVLLLVFKTRVFKNKKNIIGILVFLISAVLIVRTIYVLQLDKIDYNFAVRTFIPLRLDALMTGVLIAAIKIYYNTIYKTLSHPIVAVTALLLFLLLHFAVGNILVYDYIGRKFWASTIGFTLTSILFSLLIPFFERNRYVNKVGSFKLISYPISKLSLYTYCIYLIHEPIYEMIIRHKPYSFLWGLDVVISLSIIILISAVVYKFFEKPVMDLRDKVRL